MFRSKPSYRKCFRVNHQAEKVSECVWNILEGARKVSGPSGIFRTAPMQCSCQGDSLPLIVGCCFWVGPPLWGCPHLVEGCWGGAWWGAPPTNGGECWKEVGPPLGAPHGRPRCEKGAPMGQAPTFGGCMFWRGPPFWAAISSPPPPLPPL